MKYSEITLDQSKCPEKGYVLAYTRGQVIFKMYDSLNMIGELLGEQDVLELHLFDRQREYRLLSTRSKRYQGCIEAVADFEDKEDEVYRQKIMLDVNDAALEKLYVLNHISYDDAGMATIDNYRMCIEEGENA